MFGNSAVLNLLLQVTLTTQETELKQKVRTVCFFMYYSEISGYSVFLSFPSLKLKTAAIFVMGKKSAKS